MLRRLKASHSLAWCCVSFCRRFMPFAIVSLVLSHRCINGFFSRPGFAVHVMFVYVGTRVACNNAIMFLIVELSFDIFASRLLYKQDLGYFCSHTEDSYGTVLSCISFGSSCFEEVCMDFHCDECIDRLAHK